MQFQETVNLFIFYAVPDWLQWAWPSYQRSTRVEYHTDGLKLAYISLSINRNSSKFTEIFTADKYRLHNSVIDTDEAEQTPNFIELWIKKLV